MHGPSGWLRVHLHMCVQKSVSGQIHVSLIACVSKHTCMHLNVFVFTVYMCVCVSRCTKQLRSGSCSREPCIQRPPLDIHPSIKHSQGECVLVYLCFCQSAPLTAHPAVRPSIHRPRINIWTVITRADKVSWWISLYSMGCKQCGSIAPFTHETHNTGWFSYSGKIMVV